VGQLETALEVLEAEPEGSRRERERSRELYQAAQRLEFEDAAHTIAARAVLHREGAFGALRAITQLPASSSPAEVVAATSGKTWLLDATEGAMLLDAAFPPSLAKLEHLHRRSLEEAEVAAYRVQRFAVKRLRGIGAALILASTLIVLAGWGAVALARPRDLAKGKAWRTSSVGLECKPKEHKCGKTRTDIFFHTHNEQEPWFEIDFAEPTTFSSMTVRNRMDMGVARASPLVVEVTDDHVTWREVARRPEPFLTWTPVFPSVTARYLRLRVLKKTWFHLEAVEVHP
jgi:hypothetical protein